MYNLIFILGIINYIDLIEKYDIINFCGLLRVYGILPNKMVYFEIVV